MYIWERRRLRRTIELTTLDDADRPDAMLATITGRGGQFAARAARGEWALKRRRDGLLGPASCEAWPPTGAEPAVTCAWNRTEGTIDLAGRGQWHWSSDPYSDRLWTVRNQAGEVLLRFNDVYETGPPYAEGLLRINEAGVAIGDPLTALILGCSLAVQNGRIGRSSGGYSAD